MYKVNNGKATSVTLVHRENIERLFCRYLTWLDVVLQQFTAAISYLFHLSSTHTLLITSLKTQTIDNLLHTLFSSNFSFRLFVFSLLAFSVSRHPCPIWPKLTQSTTPFPLTNLLCPPPTFVLFSTIFFSSSPPSSCPITLLAHSFTFIYSVFPSLTSEMSFIPRTRCCKEGHLSRKHFNLEMEF